MTKKLIVCACVVGLLLGFHYGLNYKVAQDGRFPAPVRHYAYAADQTASQSVVSNYSYDVMYYDIADHWLDHPNYRDTTTLYDLWHFNHMLFSVSRNTDGNCDSAQLTVYFYIRSDPNQGWFFMDSTIAMPGKLGTVALKGDSLNYTQHFALDGLLYHGADYRLDYLDVDSTISGLAFRGIKDMRIIRSTTNADNCSCLVKNNRIVFSK